MKKFMDEDFLITNETGKKLYKYAKGFPIIDYHCHLSPREIYEDKPFRNITEIWLKYDHYKWRAMRTNGVSERFITGDAEDKEKFIKWAGTLEKAIGNPLYHWSHLELKRYFNFEGHLSSENAEEVWNHCNKLIKKQEMSPRKLILSSNVEVICTTDDPADDLYWHKKLSDDNFNVKVIPSFRPDKAYQIEKDDYIKYLSKLEKESGIKIVNFDTLINSLSALLDYFISMGCVVSDHGLPYVMYEKATNEEVNRIFKKRLNGYELSPDELRKFKTSFMLNMGRIYAKRNIVMQLHTLVQRDLNKRIFYELGPDAGIDAIDNYSSAKELSGFLNALDEENLLPRTIIYSLNPQDNACIDTIIGCFQDETCKGKIQHGSAWWFNDNKSGMREHLESLANLSLLGNFVGMLTDSRSFLSYTRHEYFRRILCDFIGTLVENGEYPNDEKALFNIVKGISYTNAKEYFDFER